MEIKDGDQQPSGLARTCVSSAGHTFHASVLLGILVQCCLSQTRQVRVRRPSCSPSAKPSQTLACMSQQWMR